MASDELAPELQAFVQHLAVERRLAARTLALYTQALQRLQASATTAGVALMTAQPLSLIHILKMASRMASEIWSATLSGWPSETDSDVKRKSFATRELLDWQYLTLRRRWSACLEPRRTL